MTIARLITVLVVLLRETRVRDIIAAEALLMSASHNQIARGSRLFAYLNFVKMFHFVLNWKFPGALNLRVYDRCSSEWAFREIAPRLSTTARDTVVPVRAPSLVPAPALPNCWTEAARSFMTASMATTFMEICDINSITAAEIISFILVRSLRNTVAGGRRANNGAHVLE